MREENILLTRENEILRGALEGMGARPSSIVSDASRSFSRGGQRHALVVVVAARLWVRVFRVWLRFLTPIN